MNSPAKSPKPNKPKNYLEVILENLIWNKLRSFSGNKIIDSSLVIALFTVVAYFLTYLYEVNYLSYFGASAASARVDLESLLLSCFLLIGFTGIVSFLLFKLLTLCGPRDSNLKSLLSMMAFIGIIFIFLQMPFMYAADPESFWTSTTNYLITFGVMASVLALVAGAADLLNKLLIKYNVMDKQELESRLEAYGEQTMRSVTPWLLPIVPLAICMYASALGSLIASSAHSFQLTRFNGKDAIVLRAYRDHAVVAAYDIKANKILDTFAYIPYNDKPLEYRIMRKHPKIGGRQSSLRGPQDVIAEWVKRQLSRFRN